MKAHFRTFRGRFVALFSTMTPSPVQRGVMPSQPSGHDPTPSTSKDSPSSTHSSFDRTLSPSPKRKKVQHSPPRDKSKQLVVEERAPQQAPLKLTRRSKSVRFPLPNIGSAQVSQSHQTRSQNLPDVSKGKKHITDAPSKKDVSLGFGDSPNPIGKMLPSKPSTSLKRKRSDISISSPQDEDIPPIPTTKGDHLTGEKE
ncbi:hypothetical protein L1987_33305 [Smallanthus sonchifolius]|uniref:Uncharacterized protein n=1 Tax=Smallanthus sonchifolius TaxID=185202 RepID=A0ACB9HQ53_9ASTR|nr:hypothetical protein L1987_33305 [Smallanthus sonchifolius]